MYAVDIWTLAILAIIFSFLIAFPIIALLYEFRIVRRGEVDFSNLIEERKQKVGTPIMGGLIIVITVIVLNLIFNRDPDFSISGSIVIPLIIFAISALLGAFDDVLNIYGHERKVRRIRRTLTLIKVHKNLLKRLYYLAILPWLIYKRIFFLLGSNPGKGIQAHEKVVVQTVCGILLAVWLFFGSGWESPTDIFLPIFNTWIDIGLVFFPFVILTVLAMTNAVNLSDGMDGLAAGLLLISYGAFGIIAYAQGDTSILILIVTVVGSLLTYLYFNAPPARFQMGDVGSLSLGTLLAVVAFALRVPLLLPIICFPFVAEIGSSLIQGVGRRIFGRRIFRMAPLHHHFEMKGWNEEKVVIRFWVFGLIFAVFGLWLYFSL